MDRDALFFRLSLIWLALMASGAVYVLLTFADVLSCCSMTGSVGGKMLSYIERASRIKRARSRSDFVTNRITSPIFAPILR